MRIKEMETSIAFSRGPEMALILHTDILKASNLLAKAKIKNMAISENILDRKR
jgi:hypothetical protein